MPKLKQGYNPLVGSDSDMLQDVGVQVFADREKILFFEAEKESAFLILSGKIKIAWTGNGGLCEREMARQSLFDEKPECLHVPAGCAVTLTAFSAAEVLIQKTENPIEFEPVFYSRAHIEDKLLSIGLMQDAAVRILRDIFNYDNAPYSNMVMGEVITQPGRWSSYPPHHHPQPEVYFHRFDHPQGFGVSVIGDSARLVKDNGLSLIPGGLVHPQVSAPGYAMYYCWMIRHLEGNPWTERIDDPAHQWLYDQNARIWRPGLC